MLTVTKLILTVSPIFLSIDSGTAGSTLLAGFKSYNGTKFVDPKGLIEWWQTGVIYQVYPRSFKDSDGDGIGDLKGIEEKAEYFKDLGVAAVLLYPIYKSPMADFGYDISDYNSIAEEYGTIEDFLSLKSKLHSLGLKLILDIVPNHSSDEHEWFKKSVNKINPYTDYYVWKDPKGWKDGIPIPPNNWISKNGFSAWTYVEERKQFYYHQFGIKQPDLNYRNKIIDVEMMKILIYWMEKGVDGFRINNAPYLFEHEDFKDEPADNNYTKLTCNSNMTEYNSLIHVYTMDQLDTYRIVRLLKLTIVNNNPHSKPRVMITEAYTSLKNTMKYYTGSKGAGINMPLNYLFTRQLNLKSNAHHFVNAIYSWMDNMPEEKWPNWVSGNHDIPRTATRNGEVLVDGINMLVLLLPGTPFTYYGEEIGMEDTTIRWDQSVDPIALAAGPEHYYKFSRDPERTPFQWDSSFSAGFSKNHNTWLPVNPNYWYLNLENQTKTEKSHYHVYKRLVNLRSTSPTIQRGKYIVRALSDYVLLLVRQMNNYTTYAVIVNFNSNEMTIDLQKIPELPYEMIVHTSSINSEHNIGNKMSVFKMRPKSSLVLTSDDENVMKAENFFAFTDSASLLQVSLLIQLFPIALSLLYRTV